MPLSIPWKIQFIAVTSFDSGSVVLTSEEKQAGWQSKGGIAYSPKVVSTRQMRLGGFDEWYVFDAPVDLGKLWKGSVFEAPLAPGHVCDFVNFGHFGLHNPEVQELVTLFFKQLDWIRPESCVADGDLFLTFVTRNEELFFAARDALTGVS